jgi:hypothetical protein
MKTLIVIVVVGLFVLAFVVNRYYEFRTNHRAQFITVFAWLKEARFDHKGYTNGDFWQTEIYPYTNRFTIDGTNYVCEFAARSQVFGGRGFLAVTTNWAYVWIDDKGKVIPFRPGLRYPPGF